MRRICLLILSLILLFMSGCQSQAPDVSLQTEPPRQTEEPTVPPAQTQPPTEPPTEPTPEQLLHSGIREDGSFSEGTLFLGDSLTFGLVDQYLTEGELVGDARYMATPGAALTAYFYGPALTSKGHNFSLFSEEFRDMIMYEGVEAAGDTVTAVYLMMGTNHRKDVTVQLYIDVVDHILASCPNATVYMQLIPYAKPTKIDYNAINERIRTAYTHFAEAEEPRVRLIDTFTAIGRNQLQDGIHLSKTGQSLWYQALVDYAADNEIPQ